MAFSFKNRSITATTTAAEAVAQNPNRKYLLIQNVGSVNVGVSFVGAASIGAEGTFVLQPLGALELNEDAAPLNALSVVSSGVDCVVSIVEA